MKSTMDFRLTDEQQALRHMIKRFVDAEVKPDCRRREAIEDPAARIPWDWITTLSRMGLRTLAVPEYLGGPGADCLTLCMAAEELAVGDIGLAVILDQTWRYTFVLTEACSEEARQRYLPRFLEDDSYVLAIAQTEPDAGSDNILPFNQPGSGLRTMAVRERRHGEDGWLINGRKMFISNGGAAKLQMVRVRTDPSRGGIEGSSYFLVELGSPGLRVGHVDDKVGQRLVQNAELIFDDCWVPASNLVGPEGRSWEVVLRYARGKGATEGSATFLGVARAAFEEALAWAKQRVQGGSPIIRHQAVKMMLADMLGLVRTTRALLWQCAWMTDHHEDYDPALPSILKIFASEAAVNVCKIGMEIFGGAGSMRDCPIEKLMRDAMTLLHSDGTNQIHRLRIGNVLEEADHLYF